MISAQQALEKLIRGNARYVADVQLGGLNACQTRRNELIDGQEPFAIILGCSDSRVPAEIIFDQGLGDLFVIRVAGNVVAPSQVGSVEFAAEMFNTKLVVVMGHTQCGAIQATLDELEHPKTNRSPNLRSIVDRIRPSVEPLLETELRHDKKELLEQSIRTNILYSADRLRHGSKILKRLINKGELLVVSAEYSLETGVVEFFESIRKPPSTSIDSS
jgi:carbonic anhydrase